MKRNQQTMWLRSWTWSKENTQGRLESFIAWQKLKLKNLHMNCKSEKLSVIIFMQADLQKTKHECTKAGWMIQCKSLLPLLHSAWESTRKTWDLSFTQLFQKVLKAMCKSAEGQAEIQSQLTVYSTIHFLIESNSISSMSWARQARNENRKVFSFFTKC